MKAKIDPGSKPVETFKGAAAYTHLGMTMAVTTLGMFFLGRWVDGLIGSTPWLSITGAFLGATGGFINLVRTLNRIQEERERNERDAG